MGMDERTKCLLQHLEAELYAELAGDGDQEASVADETSLRQIEVLAQVAQALTLSTILHQLYEARNAI